MEEIVVKAVSQQNPKMLKISIENWFSRDILNIFFKICCIIQPQLRVKIAIWQTLSSKDNIRVVRKELSPVTIFYSEILRGTSNNIITQ